MSIFSSVEKALPSFILRNRASHIWRHFFSLRLLKCGRWESDEEYIKRDSRVRGLISGWVKTLKRLWSEWWHDWSLQDSHGLKQKNRKHVRVQWLAWTKERKNTLHRRVRFVSSGCEVNDDLIGVWKIRTDGNKRTENTLEYNG